MTIIDRYILKKFLATFALSIVAFIVIFIAIDLMENLDQFLDHNATIGVMASYYLYFLPEMIRLLVPMSMLLASLFTTAKLVEQSEWTSMKAAGLSIGRFMAPILCLAVLAAALSIWFNGWVVPRANKEKFSIERTHMGKSLTSSAQFNLYFRDHERRMVVMNYFEEATASASRVSLIWFGDDEGKTVVRRIDAPIARWTEQGGWTLVNAVERLFTDSVHEKVIAYPTLVMTDLSVTPDELRKRQLQDEEMTNTELKEFLDRERFAGADVTRRTVDYYAKLSFPFASVIVVLFGVPFASMGGRRGAAVQIGVCMLVCFVYFILTTMINAIGSAGVPPPLMTAWLPNALFAAVALVVFAKARK